MALTKIIAAAGATVVLYGLWKAVSITILRPMFSALRNLPGPTSWNFFMGNLNEIRKAEGVEVHEKWVKEYGKTMTYKAFFNVSIFLYRVMLCRTG